MAEQLICNQQVDGSTPFTSSILYGGIPERPKGADCKSVVTDFAGPNPASPTRKKHTFVYQDNVCFFSTKSAFVGINPLSWMKSLRDEILLRKVKGGGFNFI